MHKLIILFLGALAALTICSHGAADVNFSSGKFSSNGHHMSTGSNGHAQVGLDGQGSLVRFGSNTVADVGNEREVTLSKGLLLVSSGEGFLRRSGVVIQTPEGQITVRGTVLVAVLPDGAVKLTCLEGSVKGDLGGHGFALHAGEMIIQRVNGMRDVVQVNLHTLTHTCALLDRGGFKPLHFAGSIDQAVTHQDKVLADTQHASGHGQGESGGFLARFFSFSSQGGNNSSNQAGGNVGGATLTLSQTGGSSNSLTITGAGGALTMSAAGGSQTYSGTVLNASSNALSMNTGTATQQLLVTGSGGTFVQTNNANTLDHPNLPPGVLLVQGNVGGQSNTTGSGSLTISGGTISGSSITLNNNFGTTIPLTNGAGNVITVNNAGGLNFNPTTIINNGGDLTFTYNGQVYHGQDALNLINSLQHNTGTQGTTPP